MSKGWTVIGQKDKIIIRKDRDELTFDIEVQTPKGVQYYMRYT
jgi:hypothetical protein